MSGVGVTEIVGEIRIYQDSLNPNWSEAVDPILLWDLHFFPLKIRPISEFFACRLRSWTTQVAAN